MTKVATPRPWYFTRKSGAGTHAYGREETDGYHSIFSTARKEDGDFILQAVNAHDALVAAAQAAINHLVACEAGRIIRPFKSRSLPMLRAALVKAAPQEGAAAVAKPATTRADWKKLAEDAVVALCDLKLAHGSGCGADRCNACAKGMDVHQRYHALAAQEGPPDAR